MNPYATPSTADLTNPTAEPFWYCEPTAVFVRDGAELPMVDLETGKDHAGLVRSKRRYDRPHWSRSIFGSLPAIYLFITIKWDGSKIVLACILAVLLCIGPWLIFRRARNPIVFHLFTEPASAARFKRAKALQGLANGLQLIMMACFFAIMIFPEMLQFDSYNDQLIYYCVSGIVIISLVSFFVRRQQPRFSITDEAPKGWIRIQNLNHLAMIKLRKLQRDGANHV